MVWFGLVKDDSPRARGDVKSMARSLRRVTNGILRNFVKAGYKRNKKATVNERMLAEIVGNLENVKGLTAKQWAVHLGCGQTTVKDTDAWKWLRMFRLEAKAKKHRDRNIRIRGVDSGIT